MQLSDIGIMVVEKGSEVAHRITALFTDNGVTVRSDPNMDRVLERFEQE